MNSYRSLEYVLIVGNTLVISKTFIQISVEKSTYRSEFAGYKAIVNEALGV